MPSRSIFEYTSLYFYPSIELFLNSIHCAQHRKHLTGEISTIDFILRKLFFFFFFLKLFFFFFLI